MVRKLGLSPPIIDYRTIKLYTILKDTKELHTLDEYDFDKYFDIKIKEEMFGNDKWGNCAIVSRANQTRRFEYYEQGRIIPITTEEILNEYWREGSKTFLGWLLYYIFKVKPDNGLVMLDVLRDWRNEGWDINGNKYNIYAFASVDKYDHEEVKQAIMYLCGLQAGMKVTQSAINQFDNGEPWTITKNEGRLVGYHAIYIIGYDKEGLSCITWGKRQRMSWEFWDKYISEVYAVVDNCNEWQKDSLIDVDKLNEYLEIITA